MKIRTVALGVLITAVGIPALYGFTLGFFFVLGHLGYGDPGADVTFENTTGETIAPYMGGNRMFDHIAAGESRSVVVLEDSWNNHLKALDQSQQVVWQADITWDQLKQMGYHIVIGAPAPTTDESPVPTPE
ncbi:MAG: hypothetical protein ABSC13_03200 [Dehalococcoidia bacterium]